MLNFCFPCILSLIMQLLRKKGNKKDIPTFPKCEHVERALAGFGLLGPSGSDRGHPKTVSCERVEIADLEEGDVIWCLHCVAAFFPTGLFAGSNLYQVVRDSYLIGVEGRCPGEIHRAGGECQTQRPPWGLRYASI